MKAEKNKEFRRQKALKQRQGEYLAAQQKAEEERNRKQKEDIKRMHAERLRKKKAAEVRCTLLCSNTFLSCCAHSSNSHTLYIPRTARYPLQEARELRQREKCRLRMLEEEEKKIAAEAAIAAMEKEEEELIARLRKTQEDQRLAYDDLKGCLQSEEV